MNVDTKLLALYDKLQKQIEAVETIRGDQGPQGEPGIQGPKGEQGDVGPEGRQGADGRDAVDGKDGKDGKDGVDGISVVDAQIDIDKHLVLTLSNGEEIDAGELEALSAEAQTTYAAIHNTVDAKTLWFYFSSYFCRDNSSRRRLPIYIRRHNLVPFSRNNRRFILSNF
jgi:hypothetical protein